MADPNSPADIVVVDEADLEKKRGGFLASRTAKIVLAVVAVFVLLGVIGTLLMVFVFSSALSGGGLLSGLFGAAPPVATTTTTSQGTATETVVPVNPAEKPLNSTFTFRNVFEPTIEPSFESTASETASGTVPAGATEPDTLYLLSIQTTNGERTATFAWNGSSYTLAEGDTIPDSPWKVLTIGTDSVVMLYGDSQVTLTVGQGLSK